MSGTAKFRSLLVVLLVASASGISGCTITPGSVAEQGASLTEQHLTEFGLAPPSLDSVQALSLWSTYYFVHLAPEAADAMAIPLIGGQGQPLGVSLAQRDWCDAALEGTVAVQTTSGVRRVFNFSNVGRTTLTDCSAYFPGLAANVLSAMSRTQFTEVTSFAPFGLGTADYKLVPFRTIAVDPEFIPLGSVLYIPGLRGVSIELPNGMMVTHDGYVFAADVGGAIDGNHIDFFTGISPANPAPALIRSTPSGAFVAYVVQDNAIRSDLDGLHR